MSERINVDADSGVWFLGICLLVIAFWGEPDLVDALIHYFLNKSWMVLI